LQARGQLAGSGEHLQRMTTMAIDLAAELTS
jgi:hypothetical protein